MAGYTDFPEYGRECELIKPWRGYHHGIVVCELIKPWRGYHHGIVVALTDTGFIVRLTSGAEIEVYGDEIRLC